MKAFPKLAADPGRIVSSRDMPVGELKLALFEVSEHLRASAAPTVLLAASTTASGWKPGLVEVRHAGRTQMAKMAPRKAVLGYVTTELDGGEADAVEVLLHDPDQWLTSCADDALQVGENLAAIGTEVVQFAVATSLGDGRFRLRRVLRGRAGTESTVHFKGEPFVLLERAALQPIILPVWKRGTPVEACAHDGYARCTLMPAFKGLTPSGWTLAL